MFTSDRYTYFFSKSQATRYLQTFFFSNKMEKHNRRTGTKRDGILRPRSRWFKHLVYKSGAKTEAGRFYNLFEAL